MVRDVPIDLDLEAEFAQVPDRSRLRAVFRDWELRDPLRRLEEALAPPRPRRSRAPRPPTPARSRSARRAAADVAQLAGDELALVGDRAGGAEGELIPRAARTGASAPTRGGAEALAGRGRRPAELVAAAGDRPVVAHDAKALGDVPPNLVFDTELGRLPARSRPPRLPARRAGRGARHGRPRRRPAGRPRGARPRPRGAQREQLHERGLTDLLHDIELPLVRVLRETEKVGHQARHAAARGGRERASAPTPQQLEREIWELAGEEFMIGSPQQLAEVLFVKLGLSRKRRGKTGFSTDARVLQAIRDEHEIIPKIERWRELTKLVQTYLDALPAWIGDDGRLHTTFLQTNAATGRLACDQPEPPEHPDPHRDRARDPRAASSPSRATC